MSSPMVTINIQTPVLAKVMEISQTIGIQVNEISENAKNSPFSYEYSGRYDHGQLPDLNSTGHLSLLLASINSAKKECDRTLTDIIYSEAGANTIRDDTIHGDMNNEDLETVNDESNLTDSNDNNNGKAEKRLRTSESAP